MGLPKYHCQFLLEIIVYERHTSKDVLKDFIQWDIKSLSDDGKNNIARNSVAVNSIYGTILTHRW